MAHLIHIQSDKQYVDALRVLNKLPGMWHARGPVEAPVLLVLDSHYDALVKAGVVSPNGKESKLSGKKQFVRKVSLEEGVALLQQRFGGRLHPPLEGLAYRFTVWLPVQSMGQPVFVEEQQKKLFDLFHACFGGCSQSRLEGFPPWSGSWLPRGADLPIGDEHILLIVYTLQHRDALDCLRQLKWILQQHHVAAQEVILIEQVPVHLIEAAELS